MSLIISSDFFFSIPNFQLFLRSTFDEFRWNSLSIEFVRSVRSKCLQGQFFRLFGEETKAMDVDTNGEEEEEEEE